MSTTSTRPGMGAIPYDGGVTFRVWAPFAQSVAVTGTFNRGSRTANPLGRERDGHWSADVPAAAAGHEYRFVIDGERERIDPRAREVTHSAGTAMIVSPAFAFHGEFLSGPGSCRLGGPSAPLMISHFCLRPPSGRLKMVP